jgi:hypothetical protein
MMRSAEYCFSSSIHAATFAEILPRSIGVPCIFATMARERKSQKMAGITIGFLWNSRYRAKKSFI